MRRSMIFKRRVGEYFGLILTLLFIPLPILAQGPRPSGLQPPNAASGHAPSIDSRFKLQKRDRATTGAVIGFAIGFVGTLVVANATQHSDRPSSGGNENKKLVNLVAITVGLLGGLIGYRVGQGE